MLFIKYATAYKKHATFPDILYTVNINIYICTLM